MVVSRAQVPAGDSDFGKLPPQAIDLEEAVLGAIMLEKDALTDTIGVLQPAMFYKDSHQRIFTAIQKLFEENKPIDILTVTNQLKSTAELGLAEGAAYIAKLTNRVSSSANTEFHARIIIEKYLQRKLIEISSRVIKDSYEDTTDVLELLQDAQSKLFDLTEANFKRGTRDMTTVLKEALEDIEGARNQKDGYSGVPSGFIELDRATGGWQKSDLIILAARPGMGKTAFALNMIRNMAVDYAKPVAFFSLEMSAVQLVTRLISSETMIPADALRKGQVKDDQWHSLTDQITALSKAKIFIDDTAGLNIFELRAKCRKLKAQYDIQFVAVDYLQLMSAGSDRDKNKSTNREQEISMISRGLKAIAKELEIPILALSQLSRAVEQRGGEKKPILSDLRESGAIEQDADLVLFIYRPDYYKNSAGEAGDSRENDGMAELRIAKHRNGPTKDIPLRFISKYAKFENADMDAFNIDDPDSDPINTSSDIPYDPMNMSPNVKIMASKV